MVDSADPASLKLNAFNFFGEVSRAGLLQRGLDGLWPPLDRRFAPDRRVLHAAQRNGWNKESLDENKISLWGERSLCASANSRFCGSASPNFKRLQLFLARHRGAGLLTFALELELT
jgi:hypothetical protein